MTLQIFFRKVKTFCKDPIGRLRYYLLYRGCENWAKFRLRKFRNLLREKNIQGIKVQYADWWFMYNFIKKRKPALVFEFGSGITSFMIAQAMKENGTGHCYSFESEEYWAKENSNFMPRELRKYCEIRHSPVAVTERDGIPVFKYTGVPELKPDFVYLDGPALNERVKSTVNPLDLDFSYMIVDGRGDNVEFLKERLKGYKFRHSVLFGRSSFEK